MNPRSGNLSSSERMISALVGVALPALLFRRRSPIVKALAGTVGSALVARAIAGHCGMKSALSGQTTLGGGLRDQLHRLLNVGRQKGDALPGSPRHEQMSRAIDQSVEESFPASDPPASRLADEPPANAQAKWNAQRNPH